VNEDDVATAADRKLICGKNPEDPLTKEWQEYYKKVQATTEKVKQRMIAFVVKRHNELLEKAKALAIVDEKKGERSVTDKNIDKVGTLYSAMSTYRKYEKQIGELKANK
jgi:maltooligosyltrehalose synthase